MRDADLATVPTAENAVSGDYRRRTPLPCGSPTSIRHC